MAGHCSLRSSLAPLLLLLGAFAAGCQSQAVMVRIEPDRVIKDVRSHPLGTHPPLWVSKPDQTLAELNQLGVRYLRFGDQRYSFWSEPPWESPRRVTIQRGNRAWPAADRQWVEPDGVHFRPERVTDFDQFMALARAAHAEPLIITAYNSFYTPPTRQVTTPPRETFFQATEEWVRYANIKKQYGVHYWEIGNELWNPKEGGQPIATDVADDLAELVPRLKAIDPSIKILVSGNSYAWFKDLLQAAPQIDYLNFSWYLSDMPGGYNTFRTRSSLLETSTAFKGLTKALREMDPADRDRIGIIITEFNAIDWSNTWPNVNDLGHALCVFQQAGEALSDPRIHLALHWTTQWSNPPWTSATDDRSEFNSVRQDGSLAANGLAIAAWGDNLQDEFVGASSSAPQVRAWATRTRDGRQLNVFLLNKDFAAYPLQLSGLTTNRPPRERFELTGRGIYDQRPTWHAASVDGPIVLPPTSVTLLKFDLTR